MTPLQTLQLRKLRRIADDLSELVFETFDEENETPSTLIKSAQHKTEDAINELMLAGAQSQGVEIDPATIRVIRPQGVHV